MKIRLLLSVIATAITLILGAAAHAEPGITEVGTGIEGAIVSLTVDKKGAGYANVRECETCNSKRLKVTRSTRAYLDNQPVNVTDLGNLRNRFIFVFWKFDSDVLEQIRVSSN